MGAVGVNVVVGAAPALCAADETLVSVKLRRFEDDGILAHTLSPRSSNSHPQLRPLLPLQTTQQHSTSSPFPHRMN